jgi:hypothetical protein
VSGAAHARAAELSDDVLFLEWAVHAAPAFVEDGIDTLVFRDGLIRVQTGRFTLQRKG